MFDNDIVLDGQNNISLIYDDAEFLQSIQETLKTNAGEWFLDEDYGLRRYDILGQKINQDEATDIISESIFQNELVDRIESIDLDFDRKNRKMSVKFEIIKKTGETVVGGVEI